MQVLVYAKSFSPRVDYIFSTLLKAVGIADINFTTDITFFQNTSKAKINYSAHVVSGKEVWIQPVNLLFESDIKEQQFIVFDYHSSKAFFTTSAGDLPFDIFAASFYLISRYEEYLPHKKDMYGRYAHENSVAYKEHFLQKPLVNEWLQIFARLLVSKFPSLLLQPASFTFLPTYDIDIAFSYLHKGPVRNFGGFLNAMWLSEWPLVKERMNVLFGKQQDPFDCYEWLHLLHKKYSLLPVYFFLVSQKNKAFDKNILPTKRAMKKLVKQTSENYNIGIHPSWQSGDQTKLLHQELKKLEKMVGIPVTKSRQHYIRMSMPETYRSLIDCGVKEDYSMGYGSINGFRASYCLPYRWYDLQKNQATELTIYPFCFMDANSYYEQHYTCDEALEEMIYYFKIIQSVNGTFVTIWHNHFLGSDKMFAGWKEVYETMIRMIERKL